MKRRIYIKLFLFLLLMLQAKAISSSAEEKSTTGLVILDLERNCTSFDLFVPVSVKPNKTLLDNIKLNKSKMGYPLLIKQKEQFERLLLSKAKKIRNSEVPDDFAENLKYNLITVVELKYQEVNHESSKKEIYEYPIKFSGQLLMENYDSSIHIEVVDVKFINLPE